MALMGQGGHYRVAIYPCFLPPKFLVCWYAGTSQLGPLVPPPVWLAPNEVTSDPQKGQVGSPRDVAGELKDAFSFYCLN